MWSYFEYAEYVCDGGCVAAGEGVQQVVGQARHDIDDEARLQIVAAQQLLWAKPCGVRFSPNVDAKIEPTL